MSDDSLGIPDPRWCARLKEGTPSRPTPPPPAPPPPHGRRVVDRADFDPSYDPSAPIHCEICGSEMRYTGSCKIRCSTCGYQRDCSDP